MTRRNESELADDAREGVNNLTFQRSDGRSVSNDISLDKKPEILKGR